ncbi:MAG: chemotaxis protein CheD [Planctomycetota bacterium]
MSDAKVSKNPADVLATYSLGSCIAVCLYDAANRIGGMIHYQLPDSKIDAQRAAEKPLMFADTGMKMLLNKMLKLGAIKKRMQVKISGGAAMNIGPKGFDVGKRNYMAIRKILWKQGMIIDGEDVGGESPRNMYLNVETGDVTVRSRGLEKAL